MPHINLLPWRAEAQKQEQKQFLTILAGVGVAAFLVVFLIGQLYQIMLDDQNSRNRYLENEIVVLDGLIGEIRTLNAKKESLKARMDVIEQLQRSRNVGTQVLDEIATIVPPGVYLTSIEKNGNSIQIIGKSESNNHLANMIRNIETSKLLINPILESITAAETSPKLLSDFKMRVRIKGLIVDVAGGAK